MKLEDKIIFYMICFFLIILPILPTNIGMKNIPFSDILLVFIIIIFLLTTIFSKHRRKYFIQRVKDFCSSRLSLAMLAFFIVMCFSVLYATDKTMSIKESIRFLTYIFLAFILKYHFEKIDIHKKLLKLYTLVTTLVAFIGILGYFSGRLVQIIYGEKRAVSTFGNANSFGAFLLIGIFPIIMLALTEKDKSAKRIYIGETIILLLGIGVSGSRNSYLALVLGCIILSLVYSRKLIIAILPMGIVAICVPYISKRIFDIFSITQNQSRIRLWQIALMMIKEHPILGIGNGNYESLYNFYVKKYPKYEYGQYQNFPVHNSYLKVLSELGILGIITFVSLIICTFLEIRKFLTSISDRYLKNFYIGFLASMVVFYFMNIFDNLLFVPKFTTYFWIILSIMEAVLYIEKSKPERG